MITKVILTKHGMHLVEFNDGQVIEFVPGQFSGNMGKYYRDWYVNDGKPDKIEDIFTSKTPYELAIHAVKNDKHDRWAEVAYRETQWLRDIKLLPKAKTLEEARLKYKEQALQWLLDNKARINNGG